MRALAIILIGCVFFGAVMGTAAHLLIGHSHPFLLGIAVTCGQAYSFALAYIVGKFS